MINNISIIFPVYNEEKRLETSLKKIKKFIYKNKYKFLEIIFVDDGSNDQSVKLLKKFIKFNKKFNLKLIKNSKNFGKGFALKKGVEIARGEWFLTSDIDHSVELNQLLKWNKKIHHRNKVYFGSRNIIGSKVKKKIVRFILGRFFSITIKLLFNISLQDTQCGFKLYFTKTGREIFKKLNDKGFAHDVEIVLLCQKFGLKIIEVPVTWKHQNNEKVQILKEFPKIISSLYKIKKNYD